MFKLDKLNPRFNNAEIDDNRTHGLIALNTIGSTPLAISGLSLSGVGALVTAIVDASGNQITSFGSGTQYTDAAAAPAHPVGPTLIWNNGGTFAAVSAAAPLPVTATFTPSGTQDVNLTKVGGASFALGQQLAAASLPVVLTAAQITTLTPPAAIIVTQGTAANLKATVDFSGSGLGTVQFWDGAGAVNNRVRLNDSAGASITLGQQLAAASLPIVLTAAQITTLTPPAAITGFALEAGHLATIDSHIPALGQALAAASIPVVLTAAQMTTLTPLTSVAVTNLGTFAVQATPVTQVDTFMLGGVNIKEINAVTPLMGNGGTGTGSLRVTIASDNTAFAVNATLSAETTKVIGTVRVVGNAGANVDAATAATVPANAIYDGVRGTTALPTAVTDGQLVGAAADKYGRQVVLPVTIRDLIGTQTTTINNSTAETTVVSQAASVFNDLLMLVISNTSGTAARLDFRDTTGGSVLFSLYAPAGDTRGFSLGGVVIPQTSVNTNWTAQSSASVSDLRIYAVFAKNK
jgi:molybdenum cofactor biosynthesis enzyme